MTATVKKRCGAVLLSVITVALAISTTLITNTIALGRHLERDRVQSDQIDCLTVMFETEQNETKAEREALDERLRITEQAAAALPSIDDRLGRIEQLLMEAHQ